MTLICLAAVIPAVGSAIFHPKRPVWSQSLAIEELDLQAIRQFSTGVLWIDARSHPLFNQEHIPSALSLNMQEWDTQLDAVLDAWNRDHPIIVYCGGATCDASKEVALRLKREAQIENVFVLKGGWQAWKTAQ